MSRIWQTDFGAAGGRPATEYWLENARGVRLAVTDYGARITHLQLPDGANGMTDVVLGYDGAAGYAAGSECFGAICGRYANRLSGGGFTLEGQRYSLDRNEGPNTLHGGARGFHHCFFDVRARGGALLCSLTSLDGDMGFPGELKLAVSYTLTDENVLRIRYDALCADGPTVVNLTNHSYFNLLGEGDVRSHLLLVNADFYTPVDAQLLPTGEIRSVADTAFDFRAPTPVGARLDDPALAPFCGYDHNFVLRTPERGALAHAATLTSPDGARSMECWTTQPGLQLYTGNYLDVPHGRAGRAYGSHAGLCLETQCFPDAMARTYFPSPVLARGERYVQTTEYRFFERT